MSPENFFLLLTVISAVGWLPLIILSPFWKGTDTLVGGIVVLLLAACYTYLNFSHIGEVGGFSAFLTFEGVTKVFSNPFLIDAGWAHILAADLVLGIWMKNNAAKSGIKYWIVVPILMITIMVAPLGWILYQIVRMIKTKKFYADITSN